jgi:hypothetical protein
MERYAALDDRRGVIDFFKEAITGWFVFFVVLFAGMTAADFSLGFQLLLAAGLGLIWASAQHADHIEDELSFWKTIPDPGAGNRRALRFTYWFLAVGTWVGWLMAAALAGHLIAAAGGL